MNAVNIVKIENAATIICSFIILQSNGIISLIIALINKDKS